MKVAQNSELGVKLGSHILPDGSLASLVLSAVGQADDICLVSSSLLGLKALLCLTKMFCDKYLTCEVG